MSSQSWINSLIGGALIGLASGGLMLLNGRIAGISGFFILPLKAAAKLGAGRSCLALYSPARWHDGC